MSLPENVWKPIREERDRLRIALEAAGRREGELLDALFACYQESGADTDGARSAKEMGAVRPGLEVLAVEEVRELRRDYDEALAAMGRSEP